MRVAVVDPSGFTLPYDHFLCSALGAGGDEVRFYTRASRGPDEERTGPYRRVDLFYRRSEALRARGPAWAPYRLVKGLEHFGDMERLVRELRGFRPDVVHVEWLALPLADRRPYRALRRDVPLVLTVHDTLPFQGSPSSGAQLAGWRGSFGLFDRIVVHAGSSRDTLVRWGVDPGRISVIPVGVGPPVSRGSAAPRDTVLFFGQVKPYKGVDVLLEAWAQVAPELRSRVRLVIAGEPMMDAGPLVGLAERLGLAGEVTWDLRYLPEGEVPGLLGRALAVVLPYRSLDASAVLAKCVEHGVPVVGSRVGVIPEWVTDRRDGLLVPPGDPAALAGALTALLGEDGLAASLARGVEALRARLPGWAECAGLTREAYRLAREGRA